MKQEAFLDSYNSRIDPQGRYIYRYFKNRKRLEQFLTDGMYMTCATKFDDGFECLDVQTIEILKEYHKHQELWEENNDHVGPLDLKELKEKAFNELKLNASKVKQIQKQYYISCWYLPDKPHENELMWKSYGRDFSDKNLSDPYGFLIKISLKNFLDALISSKFLNKEVSGLKYGIVRYFNLDDRKQTKTIKYKAFRKHDAYSDERELRVVYKDFENNIPNPFSIKLDNSFYLDMHVYLSPRATYEEFLKIRGSLKSKYDTFDLQQSELSLAYNLKKLN